jgi:hypothetical protein
MDVPVLYSSVSVYITGVGLLTEEASVTMKRASNAQIVKTVAKGFAGVSRGAAMTTITVSSAVPVLGFEFDPSTYLKFNSVVQFQLVLGDPDHGASKQCTMNGFIIDDDISHAVDANSKLDFTFITGPVVWETV